jgi:hypothetical protein
MRDRRREMRIKATLPVTFPHGLGVTRNVSASGVFLETDSIFDVGDRIEMYVHFPGSGNAASEGPAVRVRCVGRVLRVEPRSCGVGVAAAIRWHVEGDLTCV